MKHHVITEKARQIKVMLEGWFGWVYVSSLFKIDNYGKWAEQTVIESKVV